MRILITGGAGFIGSNLLLHWARRYPEDDLLNLDKLTYASDLTFLQSLDGNPRYRFAKVDLCDRDAVRQALDDYRPEGVVHLAAESHVDNSIAGPAAFVAANVVGTFNLLDEVRRQWSGVPATSRRFLHVSTDEVYGSLGPQGAFTETSRYDPRSPYSATKAASDHLVAAYGHTYGIDVAITNCSNNFGPHQHNEKLIPTIIRTALKREPIPVYGQGTNVRDWLYVADHCDALDAVFHRGRSGERYNIGARNEWRNLDLVHAICAELDGLVSPMPKGGFAALIRFVADLPGHDLRYAIDPSKVERELGWRSTGVFHEQLRHTIHWYLERSR